MQNSIQFEISDKQIEEILILNKKVFNSLKNKLTRFFLETDIGEFNIYFKDAQGILQKKFKIEYIEAPTSVQHFSIDYLKFVNALLRFQIEGTFVEITEKSVTLKGINDPTTVIKLSTKVEKEDLKKTLESLKNKTTVEEYVHTSEMDDLFQLTSKLMNTSLVNNCIVINKDSATYADRSLIYKEKCSLGPTDQIAIHSFLMSFITSTYSSYLSPKFSFNYKDSILILEDSLRELTIILGTTKPDINVPSEKDLESIRPLGDCNIVQISVGNLLADLDFFEGFYEKDFWKPITFSIKNNSFDLSYSSPITSVDKPASTSSFSIKSETTFSVMSSPLQTVLGNIEDKSKTVTLKEDPEMAGISVTIEDEVSELILAKLNF